MADHDGIAPPAGMQGPRGLLFTLVRDERVAFLLVGAAVLLPLILLYTGYAYWVFRGKVGAAGGYH